MRYVIKMIMVIMLISITLVVNASQITYTDVPIFTHDWTDGANRPDITQGRFEGTANNERLSSDDFAGVNLWFNSSNNYGISLALYPLQTSGAHI